MSDQAPSQDSSDEAAGQHQAMLEAFMARRQQMEALVRKRVGCRVTAADLVQELFLRFWKRPVKVRELETYLLRSARNLAIDHLRREEAQNRLLNTLSPEPATRPAALEEHLQASAELDCVDQVLRQLPERTRHIFLLNRIHGRTYAEIARGMQLSPSAVEKHMMRALQACKVCRIDPSQPFGSPAHD